MARHRRTPAPWYRLVAGGAGLLLLTLIGLASLRFGMADLNALGSSLRMEGWRTENLSPSPSSWSEAMNRLQIALKLDPNNPALTLKMVNLIQQKTNPPHQPIKARNKASLTFLRRTIQLQPASAYGWAKLASTKFRAKEWDDETWQAMNLAVLSAPHDPPIQRTIGMLTLSAWPKIPLPQRPNLEKNLSLALQGAYQSELIHYAKLKDRTNLIAPLCPNCITP
ncbi:MAG: hypothetical protein HQL72_06835 [Magnetococcales bacterium]|nr:hypothetical protein [Magnetococcales bacterium]